MGKGWVGGRDEQVIKERSCGQVDGTAFGLRTGVCACVASVVVKLGCNASSWMFVGSVIQPDHWAQPHKVPNHKQSTAAPAHLNFICSTQAVLQKLLPHLLCGVCVVGCALLPGKLKQARQLCCQAGQAWRSLSLSVGGEWGPLPVGPAAQKAAQGLDSQVSERVEDNSHSPGS